MSKGGLVARFVGGFDGSLGADGGDPPGRATGDLLLPRSHRLAEPIVRHRPDLALHGYAHAGTVEGTIEGVPVFSVSVPVIKRDVWLYEHAGAPRAEREGRQLRMV